MNASFPPGSEQFDYSSFIDGFEEVTYWHFDWYSRIMAVLLYNGPRPALSEHECRFGRFMETHGSPPGRQDEFDKVHQLHVKMHQAADTLITSAEGGAHAEREAFDEFVELQSLFLATCFNLMRDVFTDICERSRARSAETS
ncbi:MAG: CZB domain-containing protein [Halothiobacillaceae bacterium]|nr:CZB domain-containing protein [Halothiobacillaceae bacterium]